MIIANFLLSFSTALLGLIYKNSLEQKMAFSNRMNQILAANKLEKLSAYTEETFNILCLIIILVPMGFFAKGFRFTHFLAGIALLMLNFLLNFDVANPLDKYFLMINCLCIGLLVNGSR